MALSGSGPQNAEKGSRRRAWDAADAAPNAAPHFQPFFLPSFSYVTFQNVRQSVQHSLYQGETTMAQRHHRGWLKKETRRQGETWVLFFRSRRKSDGKRVENKIAIGLVKYFPEKSDAWAEVERLHFPVNEINSRRGATFEDLAQHYAEHELADHTEPIHAKAHTTVRATNVSFAISPSRRRPNIPDVPSSAISFWIRQNKVRAGLEGNFLCRTSRTNPSARRESGWITLGGSIRSAEIRYNSVQLRREKDWLSGS